MEQHAVADQDAAREELARAALGEITDPAGVGRHLGMSSPESGVVDVRFASAVAGYPDWVWTVSLAEVDGARTVMELQLLPGEGSLLAPHWVPWVDRLADYRAHRAELRAAGVDTGEEIGADSDEDPFDDDDDDLEGEEDDAHDDEALVDELDAVDDLDVSDDLDGVDLEAAVGDGSEPEADTRSEPGSRSRRTRRPRRARSSG